MCRTFERTLQMVDSHSTNLQDLVPAGERVLEITTTTGCVVGCSYCPQDKFAERQRVVSHAKHLRLEDFKKCLARVPKAVDISFSGYSEAWLNPACTEMVEHAYEAGHGIRISTTLVGMKERNLRRLQAMEFRVFLVHVFDDGTYMNSRLANMSNCYVNWSTQAFHQCYSSSWVKSIPSLSRLSPRKRWFAPVH